MKPIFQERVLQSYIDNQDEKLIAKRWAKFQKFKDKIFSIKKIKEEKYQDGFLNDIFVDCLGYTMDTVNPQNYNLERERKNESDSKKVDGAITVNKNVVGYIELKGQDTTDLDKTPKDGLSPVDQAFRYMYSNSSEFGKYVIVSNFDELRFYIKDKMNYERFSLFNLNEKEFKKLHTILSFESIRDDLPLEIKEKSVTFEVDISNKFYKDYVKFRTELFENILEKNKKRNKLELLNLTQKLIDRIVFILFAEDTTLLPLNTIYTIIKNHKEHNFEDKSLYEFYQIYFNAINKGSTNLNINKYNGGLFAQDERLDTLKIDDKVLQSQAKILSAYNFGSDISVNILGHIFEQSISDLEELTAQINEDNFDKKDSKRKKDGIFYTPAYITSYIVENTLGKMCRVKREELNLLHVETLASGKKATIKITKQKKDLTLYKEWITNLKILDPACGSGAFLNQALEFLLVEHKNIQNDFQKLGDILSSYEIDKTILENNLYGVDINESAVEIAKLSLWLKTANNKRPLTKLANKIKCGNSLIDDKSVVDNAFVWEEEFPEVFKNGGFDVVIGNPPYIDSESMTKSYQNERKWITKEYKTTVGNWDIFIPFVELGLKLLKENRFLSFIIPNKILSAKYGTTLREYINKNYSLNEIFDLSINNVFDIDVYPVIVSFKKEVQDKNIKITYQKNEKIISRIIKYKYENNWALYNDINYNLYSKVVSQHSSLNTNENYSLYSSASVSEAYEIKEFIENSRNFDNNFLKLINTGTIDPYMCSWGISAMTYIKDTYKYPIVNLSNIKNKTWTIKPKIAFAGMAIRIEAFIDMEGIFLPLKSTTVLTANNDNSLKFIGSILNSKLITFIFKIANSANTMAGGYLNVNQDNLGMLPIPKTSLKQEELFINKADVMIELNIDLQIIKQNFITDLELEKVPKKLQNFENLSFEEFIKEFKKAKKLKFETKLQERELKDEWRGLFEKDTKETQELKSQIDKTDKEIDKMVYELYGLSRDEVKIVEEII